MAKENDSSRVQDIGNILGIFLFLVYCLINIVRCLIKGLVDKIKGKVREKLGLGYVLDDISELR